MTEPVQFKATAWGYTYTWEVIPPGLQVDAHGTPFIWARPVQRHPGRKPGRLRGDHVFHLTHLTADTVEFFRARVLR